MPDKLFKINEFLESNAGFRAGLILDVRPAGDFLAGHLAGSVSHPLELDGQPEDIPSIILPPRHEPLLVVGDRSESLGPLAKALEARGRVAVTALALDGQILSTLPPEMVAAGPNRNHLWAPPPWLTEHLNLLPPPALGPVLDLACGSGRAAVYLAELGYQVTGLDWQPEALELGRQLAASRGVACDFVAADLRKKDVVPGGPWSIILNFRYLQRDLMAGFDRLLRPGGVALVRTFRDAPGYEGHPHRRHRLDRCELLKYFPRGYFEIIAHEESFDADRRPAAGITVRRL